ncbi:hypothetical protein J6590_033709 [Homalodisca vitripennis]|nr:hypothetical protein J6590_033709 [Homalodisca vitripennis]
MSTKRLRTVLSLSTKRTPAVLNLSAPMMNNRNKQISDNRGISASGRRDLAQFSVCRRREHILRTKSLSVAVVLPTPMMANRDKHISEKTTIFTSGQRAADDITVYPQVIDDKNTLDPQLVDEETTLGRPLVGKETKFGPPCRRRAMLVLSLSAPMVTDLQAESRFIPPFGVKR